MSVERKTIRLRVNGAERSTVTDPRRPLLDVLREDFGLTGTKYGCGEGQCRACTVLLDNVPARACLLPVSREADTGDPAVHATRLAALHTNDGSVLLFNLHLSGNTSAMVEFPSEPPSIGDPFAIHLFGMSTVIPDPMIETSRFPLQPGARGFVFNGGATSLTQFFMWGTPFAGA